MANHVRQQIREALATAVTGLTTTGARVYQSRVYPLQDAELPCLLVYTKEETSEIDTMTRPRGLSRSLVAVVEAVVKTVSNFDDTADTVAKEVEAALGNNLLSNLVKDLQLLRTVVEFRHEGEKPVGFVRMEWGVLYRTVESTPDVAI